MEEILESIRKTQEEVQACIGIAVEKLIDLDRPKKEKELLSETEILMYEFNCQLRQLINKVNKRISQCSDNNDKKI